MTNTPNQDVLHRRLRAAMDRPENQSCCDCGDHKPTWASIIVPPANVPPDVSAQPMGAFCCFHCSGAHRRLGVHICFVRSVTLDDWKEKEVVAIELGGNKRVNRAFEARLSARRAALEKPNSKSDLEMRDQFVKAKYRDHKYFDPTKYATEQPPTPMKKEPDIDPTLFHGMESVNLFSPTQISKYVDATATTTSQNIPNIHTDDDKINPADEAEPTLKRQTSMEKESSDRGDPNEGNRNDEPKKPGYFLPLKETAMESTEQLVVSQGKGPSNHSRSRTSRERDERSSSRSRARRTSRSHDSCDDESLEKNTGRRSLRRSNSKSPKRSTSQSRRSQLKQSRAKRHPESQSQQKEGSKTTSNLQSSTPGSTEGAETSVPMRRNLSGPSVANVSLAPSASGGENGSATLMRKSSSLLSLSGGSGSNLGLAGKQQQEVSSLRNATFSAIPSGASSNRLETLPSRFAEAQRSASEYIMQELAKIQVASQGNVPRQSSLNDASRPASTRRASQSKSPPRSSLSGRRAKSRHSSSPEVEPKREETSTSGQRSARQVDENKTEEERNKPSSYLSLLNDESGDNFNSRGQETSNDVPTEIGGMTTLRVASKYALAEMEDMQNSFQQDPLEKSNRRSARRMPTSSRRGAGGSAQRHQSRSRSRGSTASRSPSSSPSDPHRSRLSLSRSPSTDMDSRHSESKSPPPPTGDEEENNEFIVPLARMSGRNAERAQSHGSSARRMIRQASSRDVPGEQKSFNLKGSNTPPGSRPTSRRSVADDTNQSDDVDETTNEFQQRGAIGPTNRTVRANRQRRDPLSSKSDHQPRPRGRMANRVDAANQKAAMEQACMTQTRPAPPSRSMLARTASMSLLDTGGGGISPPRSSSTSQEGATAVATAPGPTRRADDRNSLSCASTHGNHPRSNRMLDRNGLGGASSHGVNPRMLRGKTAATAKASSGNGRILQLYAAGPAKDEASTSVNDDDEDALTNTDSLEGAERRTKALSAAALKAMRELKQITG